MSNVNHPGHYGGEDNPHEAIKVIEAWELGFSLGNAVKYISRAGKKAIADELEDLKKARWYLDRHIASMQGLDTEDAPEPEDACGHEIEGREAVFMAEARDEYVTIKILTEYRPGTIGGADVVLRPEDTLGHAAAVGAHRVGVYAAGARYSIALTPGADPRDPTHTVSWLIRNFPPAQYSYYLERTGD